MPVRLPRLDVHAPREVPFSSSFLSEEIAAPASPVPSPSGIEAFPVVAGVRARRGGNDGDGPGLGGGPEVSTGIDLAAAVVAAALPEKSEQQEREHRGRGKGMRETRLGGVGGCVRSHTAWASGPGKATFLLTKKRDLQQPTIQLLCLKAVELNRGYSCYAVSVLLYRKKSETLPWYSYRLHISNTRYVIFTFFSPNEQRGGGGGVRCQTFSFVLFSLFNRPRAGLATA